jgi:tetratricopeptide (TPR) repeat protein
MGSRALALLVWVWLLQGCSALQTSQLSQQWPASLPNAAHVPGVPFVLQQAYQCGPASLAMAFSAAGLQVEPQAIEAGVFLPGRQGSLQVEMLAATRRHGLLAYLLEPRLEVVLRELAAGHPVIVLQNLGLDVSPVWHYAVLTGFDRENLTLQMHSGPHARLSTSLHAFEHTWVRAGSWAMVALSVSQWPATARLAPILQALAALEKSAAAEAWHFYQKALVVWPQEPLLHLGAGNVAHALNMQQQAEEHLRQAVVLNGSLGDAWHNLALVLKEQGRDAEALQAIQHAVQAGGMHQPQYLALEKAWR